MIYLDHAATTFPYPEVTDYFCQNMGRHFANPASLYDLGIAEEKRIRGSLTSIAEDLGCDADELIVTSGATESTNNVIKGHLFAQRRRGKHMITSAGEHSATYETCKYMNEIGYTVDFLPLREDGSNDYSQIPSLAGEKTTLLSFIAVNNETGAISPIDELIQLRDRFCPQAAIHIDYVQGWNRLPINLHATGVDYASFSGHKIHGPKGVGLLYVRKGRTLPPLLHGGDQQRGRRSGTEHSVAVGALALASRKGAALRADGYAHALRLRQAMIELLQPANPILRDQGVRVPHILSLSFPGIQSETLLHMLEAEQIYVSTQSACSSKLRTYSRTLEAMGVSRKEALGSLRLSFDATNTMEEVRTAGEAIVRNVKTLRKHTQT